MKYILILILFFAACTTNNKKVKNKNVSAEPLDTVKTTVSATQVHPALFENAFIKGTTEKIKSTSLNLYGVNIGKIKIESGRIVACDPFLIGEYGNPFTQVFPKGEFPVQLSIAELDGDEMVAFARIVFSDAPVAKWEFALLPDQKQAPLDGKDLHGYIVDAGLGSFMDEEAKKAIRENTGEGLDKVLYREIAKHQHNSWKYALYNFGSHNMAAFTAGMGDGRYATYIGLDAEDKPCRLVTDFGLFNWRR